MATSNREVERAGELARAAGALVVAIRDKGMEALGVERKPGDEPVTAADRAANELIVSGLRTSFPDDIIVSEESAAHDRARLTAERVWYVDPIDGTKDFIRGEDGFSVMIGLCIRARPTMAVVYQPTLDFMYSTTGVDDGAWLTEGTAAPRQIHVSNVADASNIRMVASRSHRGPVLDRVKSALHIKDEVAIGSVGLKLGLIASGERDLYVNPSPKCKAWDTCAPEAILVAAGGLLTDAKGGPIRYDEEDLGRRRGLVASNGLIHAGVLERLAGLIPG